LAAAISAVTRSREQMIRKMVDYVLTAELTRVVWTVTVLWFGMQVEKLEHCYFYWVVSVLKQRIVKILPQETTKFRKCT